MTPASSKTQIIWLEDRIVNLEKRLDAVERLNKPPTKSIATVATGKQWGWTLIPKPLTDEEIIETCDAWVISDIGRDEVIKIVRRTELAHGIGEKDE